MSSANLAEKRCVKDELTSFNLCRCQETDKATMDVEAQEEGVLAKILVCCHFTCHGRAYPARSPAT